MTDETKGKEPKSVNDIGAKVDRMAFKFPKPRLITIIPLDNADGTFELIYAFHYNNQYTEVRYTVKEGVELESLSTHYAAAINMEREIVDMMGLRFKGIEGGMLLDPRKGIVAPLRKPRKPTETAAPAETATTPTPGPAPGPGTAPEVKP